MPKGKNLNMNEKNAINNHLYHCTNITQKIVLSGNDIKADIIKMNSSTSNYKLICKNIKQKNLREDIEH